MQEYLKRIRRKVTIPFLYCMVPLIGLPFLVEPDGVLGKVFLVCKFGLIALLYILHFEKVKTTYHVIFGFLVISMLIASIINNAYGVFLLFSILFMAFIVFPVIDVPKQHKRNLLLLFELTAVGVFVYIISAAASHKGFLLNIKWYLDRYSPVNTNTCGFLLLTTFFYFVSYLDQFDFPKKRWITVILSLLFVVLLTFVACRTALFICVVFLVLYFLNKRFTIKPFVYYFGLAIVFFFCLLYCVLWNRVSETIQLGENFLIFGKEVFSGRETIWITAFRGFLQKPIFGNGTEYLSEMTGFSSAHNVLLGILVNLGIFPAIGYIYFLLSPKYILSIKAEQDGRLTVPQLCFATSIFSTVFECSYTDARMNFLFLPLLLFCQLEIEKEPQNEHKKTISVWLLRLAYIAIAILTIFGVLQEISQQSETVYFSDEQNGQIASGNIDYAFISKGTCIDDNTVIFQNTYISKKNEPPNKFNTVAIQLLSLGGDYIDTLYTSTKLGTNCADFSLPTQLKPGYYRIRLKGNTNLHDEAVDILTYLENKSSYSCSYVLKEFTENEVMISEFSIAKQMK